MTDQRSVGVSLGDCDLNALSDADFKRITDTCGEPNRVGEDANQTQCTARVVAKPKVGFPGIVTASKLIGVRAAH